LGERNPNYQWKSWTPEHKKKFIAAGLASCQTVEANEKRSQTRIRKGLSKGKNNPMSNPETLRKWCLSNQISPNKPERELFAILEKCFPSKYALNVTAKTVVAGKIPDFIDVRGKRIVEMFGTYWHQPEEEAERASLFAEHGFDTLIIWEPELKDPQHVMKRIQEFHGGKNAIH